MTDEFKKIKNKNETRYVLETATAGSTGAGAIASVGGTIGKARKRDNILAQEDDKTPTSAEKPRNFVAKHAKTSGAGAHKHKKKEQKQGVEKHKKMYMESLKNRLEELKSQLTALKENNRGISEAAKGIPYRVSFSFDDPSGKGTASGRLTLNAPDKAYAARYALSDLTKRGKQNVKILSVTPQKPQGMEEGFGDDYRALSDKVDQYLIKAYEKFSSRDQIIDAAKAASQKAAQQLGIDPNGEHFKEIWMRALAGHDVDTGFGDNDDDFDYTDYSMRKGERGVAEELGYDEVSPKSASYILRKLEQDVSMSEILDDFPELGRMMDVISREQGLHPDDDFEQIEDILRNDLEDIAAQDDDFGEYDQDDEEPDPYMESLAQKLNSVINEKAVSKAQQQFMGMVHAAKKGSEPASKEVAKVAKGMSKKDAKDFASTKHKGLPEKKPKK